MFRALIPLALPWVAGCAGEAPSAHTADFESTRITLEIHVDRPGVSVEVGESRPVATVASTAGGIHPKLTYERPVIARCDQSCTLRLPPGDYHLSVSGDTPAEGLDIALGEPTVVTVHSGNKAEHAAWTTLSAVGGVAGIGLIAALPEQLACSSGSHDACTRASTLAVVGVLGAATAIFGACMAHANDTELDAKAKLSAPEARGFHLRASGLVVDF